MYINIQKVTYKVKYIQKKHVKTKINDTNRILDDKKPASCVFMDQIKKLGGLSIYFLWSEKEYFS